MKKSFCILILVSSVSHAALTFSVNFTTEANNLYSAAQRQLFNDGINYWDSIIDGHQDGIDRTLTITVDAFSTAREGNNPLVLGSAGPSMIAFTNTVVGAPTSDNRYIIATTANVQFNVHPDAGTLRSDVILHEIGHAIGIGTLWEANETYNDGDASNNVAGRTGSGMIGEYLGLNGLAAYRNEFDASATHIPVELSGGPGTAHGHWNEADDAGFSLTGITDAQGRDLRDELMTGFAPASDGDGFVSNTTIQSLRDIGFTVVPEPSSVSLIGLGLFSCLIVRKRF